MRWGRLVAPESGFLEGAALDRGFGFIGVWGWQAAPFAYRPEHVWRQREGL